MHVRSIAVASLAICIVAATPQMASASADTGVHSVYTPTAKVQPMSGGYPECSYTALFAPSGPGDSYARLPSTTPSSLGNCTLNQGTSNSAVEELQRALNGCYNRGLALDGQFGPATRSALRQVQSSIGVSADGIFGPATRDAIAWPTGSDGCRSGYWIRTNFVIYYN